MKPNVGKADMIVRIVLAVVIFALGYYFKSWWGLVGIVPLATAFVRWCPAYWPFGISTAKKEEVPKGQQGKRETK
jgi:hypothetical protein